METSLIDGVPNFVWGKESFESLPLGLMQMWVDEGASL